MDSYVLVKAETPFIWPISFIYELRHLAAEAASCIRAKTMSIPVFVFHEAGKRVMENHLMSYEFEKRKMICNDRNAIM